MFYSSILYRCVMQNTNPVNVCFYNMGNWLIKTFPAAAVLISLIACWKPTLLNWGGALIIPLLGFIMLGMGATLAPQDFLRAVKKPRAVVIGMILQFTLMPLLAFAVGKMFDLPREQLIGLVMVGSVAGGTASNVITYLAGGDVALSITMTACSTAVGVVLTPLISGLYLQQMVPVPVWSMFKSILLVVALPVALGLLINRICCKKSWSFPEKVCPVFSAVGIVLVIGIIVSLNTQTIFSCGALVLAAVMVHNISGIAAGYLLARICRLDNKSSITIAIEVGMQNSGLAAALSTQFFGAASALPGTIFSVWHNISGALLAAVFKHFSSNKSE